jgi:hypothetical protein
MNVLEPAPRRWDSTKVRPLNSLKIGDRTTVITEITQIKQDTANTPPKWVLYSLYDGASTIRAFGSSAELQVGDIIGADLEVREGKPFQNRPQFLYKLHSLKKLDQANPQLAPYLQKFEPHVVLRKSDLQQVEIGARVKLLTHLLMLHPKDNVKGGFQKVILADVEGEPISLWFPLEVAPTIEAIKPDEHILLRAYVKQVAQNKNARYLSFEHLLRGPEVYKDPLAQQYLDRQIHRYLGKVIEALKLKRQAGVGPQDNIASLLLSLQIVQQELDTPNPDSSGADLAHLLN